MRRRFALLIAALASGVTQVASAGPLEEAHEAYARGDKATAVTILTPLAEAGDAKAQSELGDVYFAESFREAPKWYKLAAAQGYIPAIMKLGWLYSNGEGVAQSYQESAKWYRLAAVEGVPAAQFWLGDLEWKLGDVVHGHMWENISKALDFQLASSEITRMENEMTSQQILQAQNLALRCQRSNYKDCDDSPGGPPQK